MKKVFDALMAKNMPCKCPICEKEYECRLVTRKPPDCVIDMVCRECEAISMKETKARAIVNRWNEMTPEEYRNTDPSMLPDTKAFESAITWEYGRKGIILMGPTGSGKSRTAYLLLQRLMLDGHSVSALRPLEFGHECAKRFGDGTWVNWIEYLYTVDVLFLDDFAKEPMTERVESELFGVIEHRTSGRRPIITTMNLRGKDIEDVTTDFRGPMIVRRLREFCDVIKFNRGIKCAV